jgi:hypothetical protein
LLTVSDEGQISSPKKFYTLAPMKPETWWRMYVNKSAEYRDIQKSQENSAVTLNIEKTLNESVINLGAISLKESETVDSESGFNWQIVTKMSDEVVKGRIPPDKLTDENSREEETQVEKRRDKLKLGEYIGFEILAAVTVKSNMFLDMTPYSLIQIYRSFGEYTASTFRAEE